MSMNPLKIAQDYFKDIANSFKGMMGSDSGHEKKEHEKKQVDDAHELKKNKKKHEEHNSHHDQHKHIGHHPHKLDKLHGVLKDLDRLHGAHREHVGHKHPHQNAEPGHHNGKVGELIRGAKKIRDPRVQAAAMGVEVVMDHQRNEGHKPSHIRPAPSPRRH